MQGQLTIFDWMPSAQNEPDVGAYIKQPGAAICHIMRQGYIGKRVCFDASTQSKRQFRVGILEAISPDFYWHLDCGEYKKVPCDRVTIYVGTQQRSFISLHEGINIYECLPWDAYPERMKAIGRR